MPSRFKGVQLLRVNTVYVPSGHTTLKQRRFNESTLFLRCVPAGYMYKYEIDHYGKNGILSREITLGANSFLLE